MDSPSSGEVVDFMSAALAAAEEAGRAGELPIGAVVVVDGRVIATGRSRIVERRSVLAHAELEALTSAGQQLQSAPGATLVTTVAPCLMCLGAAVRAGIEHVVFAASSRNEGMAFVTALPSLQTYLGGVLEVDARELFARYQPAFDL